METGHASDDFYAPPVDLTPTALRNGNNSALSRGVCARAR
jgi:hypothetical protein